MLAAIPPAELVQAARDVASASDGLSLGEAILLLTATGTFAPMLRDIIASLIPRKSQGPTVADELARINEILRGENASLRTDNAELRQRLDALESDFDALRAKHTEEVQASYRKCRDELKAWTAEFFVQLSTKLNPERGPA